MTNPADKFASPRMAAGALFADGGRVFLVRKTDGNRWDIPGGYVDIGESPATACVRELREELGLTRRVERLLAVDWAPSEREGDKVLWVFDCGRLGGDEARIVLDGHELDAFAWVPIVRLADYTIPRLTRRLTNAHAATTTAYLEHGEQVPRVWQDWAGRR